MADTNGNRVSMTEKQKVKEITDRLPEGPSEFLHFSIPAHPADITFVPLCCKVR